MSASLDWRTLLFDVCAIDSRTLAGAAGTVAVAQRLGEVLASLGFSLQWHDPSPDEQPRGRHLAAVRPGPGPTLLLIGHTDTVLGPGDVPLRLEATRLQAAGACDMKGGCVLMLEALRLALATSQAAREARLVVLLNCSEEIAIPSFRVLARGHGTGAQACLGFEPATLGPEGEQELVWSRKGTCRFTLRCTGRAAHSGMAHDWGVNAIREIARKIELLESLSDPRRELTLNVGLVSGGQAVNQVADEAQASFGLRAYDPAVLDAAIAQVRQICSEPTVRSRRDGASTSLSLQEYRSYPPWPRSEAGDQLARRYVALAREEGLMVKPVASGGGADASHVADLAPTLDGLGIVGGGLHERGEWADLTTFPVRAHVAARLIDALCSRESLGPGMP